MPSEFIVDTDDDVTIVSANLFDKVALTNSPDICPSSGDIKGLNRQVIPVTGQTTVEVALGRTVSKVNVWIASIDEQCILGSDYFKDQGCIIDYIQRTNAACEGYRGTDANGQKRKSAISENYCYQYRENFTESRDGNPWKD